MDGDPKGPEGAEDAGKARGVEPPRSVLATLRELRGVAGSVMLPDAGSDDAPIVNTSSVKALRSAHGRYQVLGEIARGGVGIVLKSRDVDLGRDVAMKVLREEHVDDPDLVQRFVEEAQIGGQLQHPGMVQVYELGMQDDGRPFFSMKLVKGRTLGALLADRADPGDDLRGFLKIFESVCQTVAYAHEHGVSHRDLKPSNVMIGAHEQVRVVDWGLAKVKGQGDDRASKRRDELAGQQTVISTVRTGTREGSSLSMVGSIIGTPPYMAPEQARGENEQLDERSDVFALGAILCEILTGRPPYSGTEKEVLDAAANARLGDALARLAASQADPKLTELAKACMAPAREARPPHAGAVAEEIHQYLVSVEDREREARETEASAGIRLAAERKSRRLTVLTFAVVFVTLVVGGGAFVWNALDRNARQEALAHRIDDALQQAVSHRGQATQTGDVDAWAAAVSSARKALSLADGPDASETHADRARALFEQIQAESDQALAVSRQSVHDRELASRLDALRESAVSNPAAAVPSTVSAALAGYGIHLDATAADTVPQSVRGDADGVRIASALTSWAWHATDDKATADLLRSLATTFDPDPWRAELLNASEIDALRVLAASAGLEQRAPADVVDLSLALETAGDVALAGELLAQNRARNPSDFWSALALGAYARRHDVPPPAIVGIDAAMRDLAKTFCAGFTADPSWPEEFMPWSRASIESSKTQARRRFEQWGQVVQVVPLRRVAATRAVFMQRFENGQIGLLGLTWKEDNPGELAGWSTTYDGVPSHRLEGGGASPLASEASRAHLAAAVALRPESAVARALLARTLLDGSDAAGAAGELDCVAEDDRGIEDVLLARSFLATATGRGDDALAAAQAAWTAAPTSRRALHRLIDTQLAAGQLVEALATARGAPEGLADPEQVDLARRLAAIDLDLDRFVSGARKPADDDEGLEVARVLELRGRCAAAEGLYAKHVTVTPSPDEDFWDLQYERAAYAAAQGAAQESGAERERLARRTQRWVDATLEGWRTLLIRDLRQTEAQHQLEKPFIYWGVVASLRRIQRAPELVALRTGGEVFEALPDELRLDLSATWDRVASTLQEQER